MKRITLSLFLLPLFTFGLLAQNGVIQGTVTDEESGHPMIGAMIKCETHPTGAYTDWNGAFSIGVPAGKHAITVTYLNRTELRNNILVEAGDTVVLAVLFTTQVQSAAEGPITVMAERKTNTDMSLQMEQKKSLNVLDGVSAETFKKAGASTAGQAVAKVSGVSIQNGKYVVVRGLGDRYSKTLLNSMVIPGLDPDRNSVQLDVFPSSILDNIIVFKTFSPNLPGDFAGGLVNMNTKAIPSRRIREISLSAGINPAMHLTSDFISYQGGSLDFLGMDDGTRALPFSKGLDITSNVYNPVANNQALTDVTRSFNKTLAPERALSAPNFSVAYTEGNQFKRFGGTLGLHFTVNYNRSSTYYKGAEYGYYIKPAESSSRELLHDAGIVGDVGNINVRWSSMLGSAYSFGSNTIKLNLLHSQNGESRAAYLRQQNYRENPSIIFKNNLEYTQRSVSNILLAGNHDWEDQGLEVEWKLSPTYSLIDEPDIRLTAFEWTDEVNPRYAINEGVGAEATRTYRHLVEQNYNGKLDISKTIELRNGEETKIRLGVLETYKDRSFEILNYQFRIKQDQKFTFSGDANELLQDEHIWTPASGSSTDSGVYVSGNPEPANTYDAQQNVLAVYLMNELPLGARLKVIYGLRMEKATNWYTGENQSGQVYDHRRLLDEMNLLPSANIIYKLNADMNLRASCNQTLARPSFKELSNAQIVDRISGQTFIGNDTLKQSTISNMDVRWEYFFGRGEMISISSFYKKFTNPIELVAYSPGAPDNFQPRNVGDARTFGFELEWKKEITVLSDSSKRLFLGTNLTWVDANVQMSEAEYLGRMQAAREGEVIDHTRDMVGQSPYIINAFANYTFFESGLDMSLNYNVQGPRLSIVGVARNPDVYERSFHDLQIKLSKSFGADQHWKGSFSVTNILGDEREFVYVSEGSSEKIFSRLRPNRTFSLSLSYSL